MYMIKAIFFDFDGVIGDTYDLGFELSKEFHEGLSEQDFRDHHNGNVFEEPKIRFKEGDMPVFFEKQKERFLESGFFPLKNTIAEIKESFKLFVVSSTIDENLTYFLELGGYDGFFEKILGATTHPSKVEKFKMIFSEYALDPSECLFVTDTIGDIIEARKVGMGSIAVSWGYHDREMLEKERPLALVESPEDLLDAIRRLS